MGQLMTRRLVLRPLRGEDSEPICRLMKNFEVRRWLIRPPEPYTRLDADAFIETAHAKRKSAEHCFLAITLADGKDFVGLIAVEPGEGGPELGYWLGQSYWGRGLMTEAARVVARKFFAKPVNNVLRAGYISGNEASAAIQRKLGFQIVGNRRKASRPLGHDVWCVETQLTRAHYEAFKS
ncbi:MAG TPA: GNAT family N-acetyltransferase [Hyphomicrobiaceae bacterium]|nr:GNAT family N-acetyltransferase [Hyphomicrobiaceae bacterium]